MSMADMSAGDPAGRDIDTALTEDRRFPPGDEFAADANACARIYERTFDEFWETEARRRVSWFHAFDSLYEWKAPYARWYLGGSLNACYNCVDRHVEAGRGDKIAYYWEGEPAGDRRALTFTGLQQEVVRFASGLRRLGAGKGTPVGIYMGMVPELAIAMLACARIGAPFTVVFGGFSAAALAGRINDSEAKVLITADGGYRKGNVVPLKRNSDDAIAQTKSIEKVLVVKRTKTDVPWN